MQTIEYREMERQRTVVRRARWQWVWWALAWLTPLFALGGLLALWMLRRGRAKYADPAPWLADAKPMLMVYVGPIVIGSILLSLYRSMT